MYDKEFEKYFEVDIEHPQLDEMKFVAGGFYHQEFKNGDALYFRADSLQKDGTWHGRWVNVTKGKIDSKKAQKASVNPKMKTKGAEHGEPHWETTPKNKIPKMFNNAPVVEEIAGDYNGKVKVGKVNIDYNQQIAMTYGIRGIPALLVFNSGAVANQIVGAVPKNHITQILDEVIK